MIELKQVSKQFGHKKILTDINLLIHQGEFISLVGANGAGKTTLLRMLAGLSQPNRGSIRINGFVYPQQVTDAQRWIAYLGHHPALYGDMSAIENLQFFCAIYGHNRLPGQMIAMLKDVGLCGRRDDLVGTFSRGMKQRLSLAVALLGKAKIFLLDEPFTGLDEEGQAFLQEKLVELHLAGCTIVMSSHDQERVGQLSDRVVKLENTKANWQATIQQRSRMTQS